MEEIDINFYSLSYRIHLYIILLKIKVEMFKIATFD